MMEIIITTEQFIHNVITVKNEKILSLRMFSEYYQFKNPRNRRNECDDKMYFKMFYSGIH